jgi:RimJ/RimL family protein N-acetyltransferase
MRPCTAITDYHDEVGRWVAARIPYSEQWVPGAGYCVGFASGSRLIAGAAFFRYNRASIEVGFASENPRWLNTVNLWQLFTYPFDQLGVRRVTAIANASNLASRTLITALGFTHEATLAQAAPDGDQLVYRMLRGDCKWLKVASRQRRPITMR